MLETLISRAAETKERAASALRLVFDRANRNSVEPVAINLDRVTRGFSETPPPPTRRLSNVKIESWKNKDMQQLEDSWRQTQDSDFDPEALRQFQNNLHNLQGASTLYGGDVLIRLTESLQKLLLVTDADPAYRTLIDVHVQACRAAIFNEEADAEATSEAVCQALETQVMRIIQRGF